MGIYGTYKRGEYMYAIGIAVIGVLLLKVGGKVWRAIFGSLSDPVWRRR